MRAARQAPLWHSGAHEFLARPCAPLEAPRCEAPRHLRARRVRRGRASGRRLACATRADRIRESDHDGGRRRRGRSRHAAVQWRREDALWHALANALAEASPRPIADAWVIDGDTIDDRATGVRYRLANIDAPETGAKARCRRERMLGEAARRTAIAMVRAAAKVEARRTFRTDRYGRLSPSCWSTGAISARRS